MYMYVKIYVMGAASTNPQLSRKRSKLRLSFSLCNNMTYRRILWQSLVDFFFNVKMPFFEKNTKAIVHGIVKNGVSA